MTVTSSATDYGSRARNSGSYRAIHTAAETGHRLPHQAVDRQTDFWRQFLVAYIGQLAPEIPDSVSRVFSARRYASAVYDVVVLSVCLS